jgi:ATP-binding cassette subfamily B protein
MGEHYTKGRNPITRVLRVLKLEKKEISAIYFYAMISGQVQLSLPLGIQSIISFVLGGAISTSLVVLIALVVLGVFLNGFVSVNQMRLIEKVQQKLFVRYSFEYANRIPRLDLKSVDHYYLPELVNRFFDTISLQKGISKLLLDIPTATIQILFGMLLLSFYHPIFIAFSVFLILLVSLILYYSAPRGMETSIRESVYKYKVAGWLEELARVIKSFKFSKGTQLNLKQTDNLVSGYLEARTSHFKILIFQYWTLIGFKVLITAAMLIVGSYLLISQQLNIGQFIAAEIVILLVINSVEKLIIHLDKVYDVLTSVEKLSQVIDQPVDEDGNIPLAKKSTGIAVQVQHLSFTYDKKEILKDISFVAEPGQKIAIMGDEGSGKSTLLRVISGAYADFSGTIMIDNVPIRNYISDTFREQTGILLNQQDIFNGTLMDNITMGNQQISPNDIMILSEKIGLKNFLEEQQDGFATILDPVGHRLSRNVIQKILLLRALINQPRLLLLEEPWTNLEEHHRHDIQRYILSDCPRTTVIVATSDVDFIEKCDQVLYLAEGSLTSASK